MDLIDPLAPRLPEVRVSRSPPYVELMQSLTKPGGGRTAKRPLYQVVVQHYRRNSWITPSPPDFKATISLTGIKVSTSGIFKEALRKKTRARCYRPVM